MCWNTCKIFKWLRIGWNIYFLKKYWDDDTLDQHGPTYKTCDMDNVIMIKP